jgi:hypothetical protein
LSHQTVNKIVANFEFENTQLSTKDTFKQFDTVGEQSGTGSAPIPIQGEQVVVEESNLPIAASPDWYVALSQTTCMPSVASLVINKDYTSVSLM